MCLAWLQRGRHQRCECEVWRVAWSANTHTRPPDPASPSQTNLEVPASSEARRLSPAAQRLQVYTGALTTPR